MRLQKYWPVWLVPEASVSALLAVRPVHAFRMVRLGPVPLRVPKTPPIRSPIRHPTLPRLGAPSPCVPRCPMTALRERENPSKNLPKSPETLRPERFRAPPASGPPSRARARAQVREALAPVSERGPGCSPCRSLLPVADRPRPTLIGRCRSRLRHRQPSLATSALAAACQYAVRPGGHEQFEAGTPPRLLPRPGAVFFLQRQGPSRAMSTENHIAGHIGARLASPLPWRPRADSLSRAGGHEPLAVGTPPRFPPGQGQSSFFGASSVGCETAY